MDKIERITKNTFSLGSIRDAAVFLELCIKNAFPEFHFRGIEIVNFLPHEKLIEGKSWNHSFSVRRIELDGEKVYKVQCSRTSEAQPKSTSVLLNKETLEPIE